MNDCMRPSRAFFLSLKPSILFPVPGQLYFLFFLIPVLFPKLCMAIPPHLSDVESVSSSETFPDTAAEAAPTP